ncbi:MAG: tetratricopeptide repeat protein [Bacteroidaceae bacterium]|nr:tetratricopeptide repeat protein [Bacteroidaceae bacterium]
MKAKHIIIFLTILLSSSSSVFAQEIPHTPRYYVHRAEGYVSSNAWNTAKREIDAGLKEYPDDADLRYLNGRYYYVIGDMKEARYNLVRATQTNDMHFKAKRVLVDVEDNLKHYSSAICYINELLEFQPYDRDLWRRKIAFYRKMKNDVEADAALKRLAHIYPNDSLVVADVRRRNHENWDNVLKKSSLREAADNLEQWIDQDPLVREYYIELVGTYVKLGEFEKAIGVANRGLVHFPDDPELINKVVGIMSDLGLYTQALAFVKSKNLGNTVYNSLLQEVAADARMRDPYEANGRLYFATHDRDALKYLINTSLTRGYYDDARTYIGEAMRLEGRTTDLLMKLYSLEKKAGNDKRCMRILTELFEKNPEDEELTEAYADMMLQLSDYDFTSEQWNDAYQHLSRLMELLPDTAETWPAVVSRQITVLGHLDRRQEALMLFKQSAERSPQNRQRFASAYEDFAANRLKFLVDEERYEEALRESQDLLEVVPSSEVALRCLINMSQTMKRNDLFYDAAAKGYEINPDNPYFVVKQAVSLQQQGKDEEALALLRPSYQTDEFVYPQVIAAHSGISHEYGTLLLKNRKPEVAMQVIESALVYDANNKDLLYDKGVAYEHLKQFDKACEYQQRYYDPSNAEQADYIRHIRYLGYKSLKNRVDASYTRAFFNAHEDNLSTIAHLYSIASVSYSRLTPRNTYTGQVSYKGIDGYHVEGENESGGVGLEFMAQWEHAFNAKWSGMANVAVSTRYFNKFGANVSASYSAPHGWTPTLRFGYRRTPPTYLYLSGANMGLATKDEYNLFLVSPSVEKSWERIKLTANSDFSFLSGSFYYNIGLKGKLFINNDNVTSVSLITGFGSFPELSFFEQTALQNVSHTNAMVGFDVQYLCSRHLSVGLAGSWNTCYNPILQKDGTLADSYRNIYSVSLQLHLAF